MTLQTAHPDIASRHACDHGPCNAVAKTGGHDPTISSRAARVAPAPPFTHLGTSLLVSEQTLASMELCAIPPSERLIE